MIAVLSNQIIRGDGRGVVKLSRCCATASRLAEVFVCAPPKVRLSEDFAGLGVGRGGRCRAGAKVVGRQLKLKPP